MASKTTNYGLHKFDLTDSPPDITAINDSMDKIDTELKKRIENTKALPIENGGTGSTDAQGAFNNLGQRAFMGADTDVNSPNQAGCYNSNGWRQTGGAKDLPTNSYGIFENKQAGGYIKQIYACTNKYGDYGLYVRLGEQANIAENEWQRVYTSKNAASLIQNLLKGGDISVVKSVQRGTVNLEGTASANESAYTMMHDVTINSINTNKAMLLINGHNYTAGNAGAFNAYGRIKNANTLTFNNTYAQSSQWECKIDWQVIEFY